MTNASSKTSSCSSLTFTPPLPAPWWLGGSSIVAGHVQTIWTALFAKGYAGSAPTYYRERWESPDHDFIDVDWLEQKIDHTPNPQQPLMILFHGLEGSSQSTYATAMANWCKSQGWAYAAPHFRSCSGEINLAPRLYHMSDYIEADWILKKAKQKHAGPVVVVGVSLGANVLLRWLVEAGREALKTIDVAASICAPLDLIANAKVMDRGFCKWIYTENFLRTMRPKMEEKNLQHPHLIDIEAIRRSKTFAEFDSLVTAPLHGFKSEIDYWTKCSITSGMLAAIKPPTLLLNPMNDPFIPTNPLNKEIKNPQLLVSTPLHGGHLGFGTGRFPTNLISFARSVGEFCQSHINSTSYSSVLI